MIVMRMTNDFTKTVPIILMVTIVPSHSGGQGIQLLALKKIRFSVA